MSTLILHPFKAKTIDWLSVRQGNVPVSSVKSLLQGHVVLLKTGLETTWDVGLGLQPTT